MRHPITSLLCRYGDTCNVYVLTDGAWALLIDSGDGDVCSAIGELGVRQIDRALFAHHHRDQCFGAADLAAAGAGSPSALLTPAPLPERLSGARVGPPSHIATTISSCSLQV